MTRFPDKLGTKIEQEAMGITPIACLTIHVVQSFTRNYCAIF